MREIVDVELDRRGKVEEVMLQLEEKRKNRVSNEGDRKSRQLYWVKWGETGLIAEAWSSVGSKEPRFGDAQPGGVWASLN